MVGKLGNLTFVFKHRWEEDRSVANFDVYEMRKCLKIGVWLKRETALRAIHKDGNKHCRVYLLGLDFIFMKVWVVFSLKRVFTFKIKK